MKQLLTFLLIACILFACNNKTTTIENFHGMWRLDKFEAFDSLANKWTDDTSRIGHSGYIMYDGKGHMSTNPKDWGTSVVRS